MIILYIILQRKSRKNNNKYIDLQIYLKLLFNFLIKRHTITRNEGIKITLSKTPIGQEIIRLYYEWSPAIVKAMGEDKEFKAGMKETIDGFLEVIAVAEE
jgi:hypothetical protein